MSTYRDIDDEVRDAEELAAGIEKLYAESERYKTALQRLLIHPALTAGASATQLAALRIVRDALRD